jgi:hypothetical protein
MVAMPVYLVDQLRSENMPMSLTQRLQELQREERHSRRPQYLMNLATFAPPGSNGWNGVTAEDPPGHLWYMYYWTTRHVHRWNVNPLPYGRLSLLASEFPEGSLSYVSFGPTQASEPECIFLRNTDGMEGWQYQWTSLPFLCERDCLRHIEGRKAHSGFTGEAAHLNGTCEWKGGRLRGVTFGPGGNFVVYRGEQFDWDGAFPIELAEALRKGKDEERSINVSTRCHLRISVLTSCKNCVLNPRNPNEYFLAFNENKDELKVYYAVHHSFIARFEAIIKEWATGKGFADKYRTFGTRLTDEQCKHDLLPLTSARSSSRPGGSLYETIDANTLDASPPPSIPRLAMQRPIHSRSDSVVNGYGGAQPPPPQASQYQQNYGYHPQMTAPPHGGIPASELPGSYPLGPARTFPTQFMQPPMQPGQPVVYVPYQVPPPVENPRRGWRDRLSGSRGT